jgi:hypothetical protein
VELESRRLDQGWNRSIQESPGMLASKKNEMTSDQVDGIERTNAVSRHSKRNALEIS